MTTPDWRTSDDDLLRVIGQVIVDLPFMADDRASMAFDAAFGSRLIDVGLLAMTSDSASERTLDAVRAGERERTVVFAAGRHEVTLFLDDPAVISGRVGASLPAGVTVETSDGLIPATLDDRGRFSVRSSARRFRLRLVLDGREYATEWVFP